VSVSNPVTSRRRPISVPASRAAPVEWLDGEVVLLAPGVALALPETYGLVTVKATGSGCAITSTAGIESPTATGPTHTVSSRSLASMESLVLAADSGTPWRSIMAYNSAATLAALISSAVSSAVPGEVTTALENVGLAGDETAVTAATPSAVGPGVYALDTTSNAVDQPLVSATGSGEFITVYFKAGANAAKISPASGESLSYDLADNAEITLANPGDSRTFRDVAAGQWQIV
jgi:hypothetical protein